MDEQVVEEQPKYLTLKDLHGYPVDPDADLWETVHEDMWAERRKPRARKVYGQTRAPVVGILALEEKLRGLW